MGEPEETQAQKFLREFLSIPLLPRLQEAFRQVDREYEVLTTLWVPESAATPTSEEAR